MNMRDLLSDFQKYVSCMTDEDIKKSIDNAIMHSENDWDNYQETPVCADCERRF